MINHVISNDLKKHDISLSKIDRSVIQKIARNQIPIESSTIDLLFHMSPFVDLDMRINISLQQLQDDMNYRTSTFEFALQQALELNLIELRGDYYYSKYHLSTAAKDTDFAYIPNLIILTSSIFKNYTLNQKKLFLYFLSAKIPGTYHSVKIENLYNNYLHDSNSGVHYFRSYRDVINALITMVEFGHIELKVSKSNVIRVFKLNETNKTSIQNEILDFFEIESIVKGNRKSWVSKLNRDKYIIKVRVLKEHVQEIRPLTASKMELYRLADTYDVPLDEVKTETIRYITSYKNQLYSLCGNEGISIYRKSLTSYFEEKSALLLSYDSNDKMANFFMDFYLIKNCINTLIIYINKAISVNEYNSQNYLEKIQMQNLLSFVNDRASSSELLLFENELLHLPIVKDCNLELIFDTTWLKTKSKVYEFVSNNYVMNIIPTNINLSLVGYKTILVDITSKNRSKIELVAEELIEHLNTKLVQVQKTETNIKRIHDYMERIRSIQSSSSQGSLFEIKKKPMEFHFTIGSKKQTKLIKNNINSTLKKI